MRAIIWKRDFKNMNLDWDPAVGHKSYSDHLVFGAKNLKAHNPEGPRSDRVINDYNAYEERVFCSPWKGRTEPRVYLDAAQNKNSSCPWGCSNSDPSALGAAALPKLLSRMHQNCSVLPVALSEWVTSRTARAGRDVHQPSRFCGLISGNR